MKKSFLHVLALCVLAGSGLALADSDSTTVTKSATSSTSTADPTVVSTPGSTTVVNPGMPQQTDTTVTKTKTKTHHESDDNN